MQRGNERMEHRNLAIPGSESPGRTDIGTITQFSARSLSPVPGASSSASVTQGGSGKKGGGGRNIVIRKQPPPHLFPNEEFEIDYAIVRIEGCGDEKAESYAPELINYKFKLL
jgi:hypothetical protein